MGIDLPLIWFVVIIFSTLMYIVMDGFDLGIGILYPFVKSNADRDLMMNSVAPVWDGNETWLVLGGAALFGAFPLAYAVILDALAIPLTLMLVALIFRGVAFEFRFKADEHHRYFWDRAFLISSVTATFVQGVVVGSVIEGFPVANRAFTGGAFDWLAPFPLFCGFGLVIAYALLGCGWLVMKTEGHLQQQMYKVLKPLTLVMLAVLAVISLWTPLAHDAIAARCSAYRIFCSSCRYRCWCLSVPLRCSAVSAVICTIRRFLQRSAWFFWASPDSVSVSGR